MQLVKSGFLFIALLFSGHCFSQDSSSTTAIDSVVDLIRDDAPAFHKITRTGADTASVLADHDNLYITGEQKCIYTDQNDEVKLITVRGIYSGIEKTVSWYYHNGELIYSEQKWQDVESGHITDHERFYLQHGQLMVWLDKSEKAVATSSAMFQEMNSRLGAYGEELRKRR